MAEFAKEIIQINLEDEMRQSYLDYAMSVIVGRALPDVRDGLKPVHRRVLYAMNELGNDWNKAFKKSARIVGDVIGKYHPHGDTAVYDTIVRMAQPFSLRYMLVDGQGNFGSVDGDAAAAMRYTEVRMSKIAHELLADLDKETVNFQPNYDESESEPLVFPTKIPNLLVNGAAGIAVGMATNIPPHNLTEVISACLSLINNPDAEIEELMEYIPAPDLPTAGIINGTDGIREAYHTGRGRMFMRARAIVEVDEKTGRETIIVTELPYQVNKARLLEKIAELVKDKKIEGISELRDESDKDGMRMVIEVKRGESGDVLLNNLYKQTQLQTVFGINMVALVDGQPRLLNLKELLAAFIRHRKEVVTRRTVFELRKARNSAHIFEGLAVALANIDEIIALIKQSSGPSDAKQALMDKDWAPGVVVDMLERAGAENARPEGLDEQFGLRGDVYRLTESQAQAILDLKLQRLTGLEQDKITADYKALLDRIEELLLILASTTRLLEVITEELEYVRETYGDERRSEIFANRLDLSPEDLVPDEPVVVTFTHTGYAKTQLLTDYRAQKRGGRGKSAQQMKDEDFVDQLFIANTHDTLLCFSSKGKAYWLKVYNIPLGSRASKGRPIVNLLPLEGEERITAVLAVREFDDDHFIFMATNAGTVKKTPLSAFSRPRANGIIAVDLRDDDCLVNVGLTDGTKDVMLITDGGKGIRFKESDVRAMGRTATGVRGIRVAKGQKVIGLLILEEGKILLATENGFGKRTPVDDFSVQGRGGQGVIAIQTSDRNGKVVGAIQVADEHQVMLITDGGTLVRTRVSEISSMSRNTQGVTLIKLNKGEHLIGIDKIVEEAEADELLDGEVLEGSPDVEAIVNSVVEPESDESSDVAPDSEED